MGYQVILPRYGGGVFSHVFQVLGKLLRMETEKSTDKPVVYFNREYMYWAPEGLNGSKNGWEYCFEPLTKVTLPMLLSRSDDEMATCTAADFAQIARQDMTFDDRYHEGAGVFGVLDQRAGQAVRLWKRWIKPNEAVRRKVRRISEQLFLPNRTVLGVQATFSPAKAWEIEKYVEKPFLRESAYFTAIDRFLSSTPQAMVFLVTDGEVMAREALARYVDKLILFPRARSHNFPINYLDFIPKMAEEIVIDSYLLSRCHHFIHGISNVSAAVLTMNPGMSHTDVYGGP